MPTILTHPAVAVAIAPWLRTVPRRVVVTGLLCCALPDIDVLGLAAGIPYGSPLGHRGLTHSLAFAGTVALLLAWLMGGRGASFRASGLFLFAATASHGVLDAMTDGGLGVGFFLPFARRRFFFPFRPIHVSPIGLAHFSGTRAQEVLLSELRWVWLPCLAVASVGLFLRIRRSGS